MDYYQKKQMSVSSSLSLVLPQSSHEFPLVADPFELPDPTILIENESAICRLEQNARPDYLATLLSKSNPNMTNVQSALFYTTTETILVLNRIRTGSMSFTGMYLHKPIYLPKIDWCLFSDIFPEHTPFIHCLHEQFTVTFSNIIKVLRYAYSVSTEVPFCNNSEYLRYMRDSVVPFLRDYNTLLDGHMEFTYPRLHTFPNLRKSSNTYVKVINSVDIDTRPPIVLALTVSNNVIRRALEYVTNAQLHGAVPQNTVG
jgi:hypothetical protein